MQAVGGGVVAGLCNELRDTGKGTGWSLGTSIAGLLVVKAGMG